VRRRLLNLLTLLSLPALVLMVTLWVVSHFSAARAVRVGSAPGKGQFVVCGDGGVHLVAVDALPLGAQSLDGSSSDEPLIGDRWRIPGAGTMPALD